MDNQQQKIFIVDVDQSTRDNLKELFESVNQPTVCFSSAYEFLNSYTYDQPGCLILELRLPAMSGLELQQRLSIQGIKIPIIFFSAHGDVTSVASAIKAGAVDFLEKPVNNQLLLDCVHSALNKDKEVRHKQAMCSEIQERIQSLTNREQQVKDMIIMGKANKVIAAELDLSIKTVEAHRAKIMRKMKVYSVTQLVHLHHLEMSF